MRTGTLLGRGETGADKFTCYRYNEGSDLTVLHDKGCPPKLPEARRDGGNMYPDRQQLRMVSLKLAGLLRLLAVGFRLSGGLERDDGIPGRGGA